MSSIGSFGLLNRNIVYYLSISVLMEYHNGNHNFLEFTSLSWDEHGLNFKKAKPGGDLGLLGSALQFVSSAQPGRNIVLTKHLA